MVTWFEIYYYIFNDMIPCGRVNVYIYLSIISDNHNSTTGKHYVRISSYLQKISIWRNPSNVIIYFKLIHIYNSSSFVFEGFEKFIFFTFSFCRSIKYHGQIFPIWLLGKCNWVVLKIRLIFILYNCYSHLLTISLKVSSFRVYLASCWLESVP